MEKNGLLRIAIATNDLLQVNANFAAARQLVIYEVGLQGSEFVDSIQFRSSAAGKGSGSKGPGGGMGCSMGDPGGGVSAEHMSARIDAVKGCALLFSKGLSDLHAVTVKNLGVYPVKMENSREIAEVVEYVQRMLERPPLWMRRALGVEAPAEYSEIC